MPLKLITGPAYEPLTLDEVKRHLRVDHEDDNTYIDGLILAARAYVDAKDGFIGRALVTQTWELQLDEFPCSEIMLPLPPLQEIVSIKYDDADGVEQTIDPANYYVDTVSQPGWVVPITNYSWPSTLSRINTVRIRFICGYADDDGSPSIQGGNIPPVIKQGMLLTIGHWYTNREEVVIGVTATQVPMGAQRLFNLMRIFSH